MLKVNSEKVYELLEKAYKNYEGDILELLKNLIGQYGIHHTTSVKYSIKGRDYFEEDHSKGIMPKQFWEIVFKNINRFNEMEYFKLLPDIFEKCACPSEFFFETYRLYPKISEYLDYFDGMEHHGQYWSSNTKLVKITAHANRNYDTRSMLLAMLLNPNCPNEIKSEIASNEKFAKFYKVVETAKETPYVYTPLIEKQLEHTLLFTNDSKKWRNPACAGNIVGDMFFYVQKLVAKQSHEEKNLFSKINETTTNEVLRDLATNNSPYIKGKIASLENCPDDILIKLATDESFYVRHQCFCNPNTPEDAFRNNIIKHFHMSDCVMMFCHPNCPADVIEQIFNGNFSYIGYLSRECPNLPTDTIARYLQNQTMQVKEGIDLFCRKNCSLNSISKLIDNKQVSYNYAFLVSLQMFYDLYHAQKLEPEYKSSYNAKKESKIFETNVRAELAFCSINDWPSDFIITRVSPVNFIDPTNHTTIGYNPNTLISNNPKVLGFSKDS